MRLSKTTSLGTRLTGICLSAASVVCLWGCGNGDSERQSEGMDVPAQVDGWELKGDGWAGGDAVPDLVVDDSGSPDGVEQMDSAPYHVPQQFLPPVPQGKVWKLTFGDEFDGESLDPEKWNVGGGSEAAPDPRREGYWVKEAMSLDGAGNLVMATYLKEGKVFSGVVDTQGKFSQAFGYFEARMKVSTQPGHWGAFWLMPESFGATDNGGVDGVEIDIMERPWAGDQYGWTNHALHWDAYVEGADASKISETKGIGEGFHTFGLWWNEEQYIFYVDGVEVWASAAGGICQVPLYPIFSDEVQAHLFFLSGDIKDAQLPDYTFVDYIRIYAMVDTAP